MSKITKRLLSLLVVITMVLAMVPTTGLPAVEVKAEATSTTNLPDGVQEQIDAAQAEITRAAALGNKTTEELQAIIQPGTVCPMCGETVEKWTAKGDGNTELPITDADTGEIIATTGHYYVTGTVNTTSWGWFRIGANSTACVVLIDADVTTVSAAFVTTGAKATINIMGKGSVVATGEKTTGGSTGCFVASGSGSVINVYGGDYTYTGGVKTYVDANGATKEYTGNAVATIETGATLNMYNNTTFGNEERDTSTASLNVKMVRGTFNMYGGTIRNGVGVNASAYDGGNLKMVEESVVNMYGGRIENGYNAYRGGNIYAASYYGSGKLGALNIYGGTITGGHSSRGGNIAMETSPLNMYGGTIENGESTGWAGNIMLAVSAENKIYGGTISDGNAAGHGGNIYISKGSLDISNATIEEGSATGSSALGGNLTLSSADDAEISITDSIIRNGSVATAANGANIYCNKTEVLVKLTDTDVIGDEGTSINVVNLEVNGGIVGSENGTNIKATNVTLNGGYFYADQDTTNKTYGKNITASGTLNISNATIAGDVAAEGSDLTFSGTVILKSSITLSDKTTTKVGVRGIELGKQNSLDIDNLNSDSYIAFVNANAATTDIIATSANAANVAHCFANYNTGGLVRAVGDDLVCLAAGAGENRACGICGKTEFFATYGTELENCDHYTLMADTTETTEMFEGVDANRVLYLRGKTLTLEADMNIGEAKGITDGFGSGMVKGTLTVDKGTLTISGTTSFEKIVLGADGKLVLKDWSHVAELDISNAAIDENGVLEDVEIVGNCSAKHITTTQGYAVSIVDDKLVVDLPFTENCPVCGEVDEWIEFDGTEAITVADGHEHYYLADNVNETIDGNLITLGQDTEAGTYGSACFYLNGKTLTVDSSQFYLSPSCKDYYSTLNIIAGNGGKIEYSGKALVDQRLGVLNVIGGTYTGTDGSSFADCLTRGVTVDGANVGKLVSQSNVTSITLKNGAVVSEIDYATHKVNSAVIIDGSWTGSAKLNILDSYIDTNGNTVTNIDENGVLSTKYTYSGTPTGSLTLANGDKLTFSNQKIEKARIETCPACGYEGEWTKFDGTKAYGAAGTNEDGSTKNLTEHVHLYLADDVTWDAGTNMAAIGENGQICLDLNNQTLKVPNAGEGTTRRIWVTGGALNVFGGAIEAEGYDFIQMRNEGTINLSDLTYTDTSEAGDKFANIDKNNSAAVAATLTLKNVTANGNVTVNSDIATVVLEEDTNIGKVTLTNGKLELDSSWSGTATLDMTADQLIFGAVDKAVVYYTGDAPTAGTLKLADETELGYEDGGVRIPREEKKDVCPECETEVTWTEFTGEAITVAAGEHKHYYLTKNITVGDASPINVKVIKGEADASLCLDLCGYTLTTASKLHVDNGNDNGAQYLNIFAGDGGKYVYTGSDIGIYIQRGNTLLEGGTYALAEGATGTMIRTGRYPVIKNATVNGKLVIESGAANVYLYGKTYIDEIDYNGYNARVTIASDWSGSATLTNIPESYDVKDEEGNVVETINNIVGDVIDSNRIAFSGAPTGALKLGEQELVFRNGVVKYKPPVLDINCPVCNEPVEWTEFDGTTAYTVDNGHMHFYLADDTIETIDAKVLLNISGVYELDETNKRVYSSSGSACFYLNGHTLTVNNGHFALSSSAQDYVSVLNIIAGEGGAIEYSGSALVDQRFGTLNVYGGTYTAANGEDFASCLTRNVNLTNATVGNLVSQADATNITLKGATYTGQIDYATHTKNSALTLDASWNGSATLIPNEGVIGEDGVLSDRITCTGAPTGTLTVNGEAVEFGAGRVFFAPKAEGVITAEVKKEMLVADLINQYDPAKVIENKFCPMCGATGITWKKLTDMVSPAEGEHVHYYIEDELTLEEKWATFILYSTSGNHPPINNIQICVVLVDANLTSSGPFIAGGFSTGSVVNVMGKGTVKTTATKHSGSDGTMYAMGATTINLYGGEYTFSGTVEKNFEDAVAVIGGDSVLNIYNNTIIGNDAQVTSVPALNLAVVSGEVNMYGGTIRNGVSNAAGANVTLFDNAEFTMYAGTVKDGYSDYRGGNFGTATKDGGKANIEMYGGTITGGTALRGGNISNETGNTEIYGGTIAGGVAVGTVDANGFGGNIYVSGADTTSNFSGGAITDGEAVYGGNIYVLRGTNTVDGATVENGTASVSGNDIYIRGSYGAELYIVGGTYGDGSLGIDGNVHLQDVTVTGAINAGERQNITLAGATTVETINANGFAGTVTAEEGWTGSANLIKLPEDAMNHGAVQGGSYVLVQNGEGQLSVEGQVMTKDEDGTLHIAGVVKMVNGEAQWYADMAAAITDYTDTDFENGNYLQVFVETDVELAEGKQYYIDATGYNMNVSGNGATLYAMDSDNAEDFEGFGEWNVGEGVTIVRDFVAADDTRYIVVTDADGVTSAHALVIGLSGLTINTAEDGLYYEAQYKCDDFLAELVDTYGIIASLKDMPDGTMAAGDARTELYNFETDWNHEVLEDSSTVYGIFKTNLSAAVNAKRGNMKIFANPYIQLDVDGDKKADVFVGDVNDTENCLSLYGALEYINDRWDQFAGDRVALKTFYDKWSDVMTQYEDLDNIASAEGSKVKDTLTWTEIDQNAGNSANMTAEERRTEALRFMKDMMSFQWTPNVKTVHTNIKDGVEKESATLEVGKVYGGTPYVTNTQGNIYTMMEYYDEETGILDLTGGMDTIRKFSNQCSGSVYWAWQRVAPSATFESTASMVAANGCLPVGGYTYGEFDYTIKDFYAMGKRTEAGYDYATQYIIEQNGDEKMYQCYAQLQPADGLVTFTGNNHARMVVSVDVRDADGNKIEYADAIDPSTIDPDKSTITYIDQSGEYRETDDGIILIGDHNVEMTFKHLLKVEHYIPFTFAEFQKDQDASLKSATTFSVENGDVTVAQLAEATVTSNYGISDVTYEVKNADGKVVYRELFITYPTMSLRNREFQLGAKKMINTDALAHFADNNYTIEISVRIGSGEKPVVFKGTLVG